MRQETKLVFAFFIAFVLLPGPAALAASPAQKDLKEVLQQLDAAATNFHSTSADFIFVTVQTDPIPDKDTQKGVVYYKRSGKSFQMAAHIRFEAGEDGKDKPVPKDLIYSGGKVTFYEKLTNQAHIKDASKYESYLLLGFGASGSELADKWDIKYLGSENLTDGKTSTATDMLELVAKDPDVKKMFPKVTIWIDPARAVSLKQVFDEGQGQSRTCFYFNIKLNPTLPDSDFTIKTDSQTQIVR
jgi:outer membrane lipoprotein-sorting protein